MKRWFMMDEITSRIDESYNIYRSNDGMFVSRWCHKWKQGQLFAFDCRKEALNQNARLDSFARDMIDLDLADNRTKHYTLKSKNAILKETKIETEQTQVYILKQTLQHLTQYSLTKILWYRELSDSYDISERVCF